MIVMWLLVGCGFVDVKFIVVCEILLIGWICLVDLIWLFLVMKLMIVLVGMGLLLWFVVKMV